MFENRSTTLTIARVTLVEHHVSSLEHKVQAGQGVGGRGEGRVQLWRGREDETLQNILYFNAFLSC